MSKRDESELKLNIDDHNLFSRNFQHSDFYKLHSLTNKAVKLVSNSIKSHRKEDIVAGIRMLRMFGKRDATGSPIQFIKIINNLQKDGRIFSIGSSGKLKISSKLISDLDLVDRNNPETREIKNKLINILDNYQFHLERSGAITRGSLLNKLAQDALNQIVVCRYKHDTEKENDYIEILKYTLQLGAKTPLHNSINIGSTKEILSNHKHFDNKAEEIINSSKVKMCYADYIDTKLLKTLHNKICEQLIKTYRSNYSEMLEDFKIEGVPKENFKVSAKDQVFPSDKIPIESRVDVLGKILRQKIKSLDRKLVILEEEEKSFFDILSSSENLRNCEFLDKYEELIEPNIQKENSDEKPDSSVKSSRGLCERLSSFLRFKDRV